MDAVLPRALRRSVERRMNAETASRPRDLPAWLAYLETLHPKSIALGLDRVRAVLARMHASRSTVPVVTVTGTNGKGSTCAMLDSMLRCAGYRVGLYTSPHLLRYNERVRIDGEPADDDALVEAFNAVEDARIASDPATAADVLRVRHAGRAARCSRARRLDVADPRGGPGRPARRGQHRRRRRRRRSRPSTSITWTISAPTREDIGREKAGIFRAGPSRGLRRSRSAARAWSTTRDAIGATLLRLGRDFGCVAEGTQWRYCGPGGARFGLPHPGVARRVPARQRGHRARGARRACASGSPVPHGAIREGLTRVELPGRFRCCPAGRRSCSTSRTIRTPRARSRRALGVDGLSSGDDRRLRHARRQGHRRRDRRACARASTAGTSRRCPVRAARAPTQLRDRLVARRRARRSRSARSPTSSAPTPRRAAAAGEADRIVVFGSFLTVAAALARGRPAPRPARCIPARAACPTRSNLNSTSFSRTRASPPRRRDRARARRRGPRADAARDRSEAARRGRLGEDPAGRRRQVRRASSARRVVRRKARRPLPRNRRLRQRRPMQQPLRRRRMQRRRNGRRPEAAPRGDRRASRQRKRLHRRRRIRRQLASRRALRSRLLRRQDRRPKRSLRRRPTPRKATQAPAGAFSVQLAAFADDKGANALANKLKKAGLSRLHRAVTPRRAGTLWRVRVGPYASRAKRPSRARRS